MFGDHYRPQRNWGARIHEVIIYGMRAIILENETLRVGVLIERGSDIFEFCYKPRDVDAIWLTPRGIQQPTAYLSTAADPSGTFFDYDFGGWQEILPNGGAPANYDGAQFGQHGEVAQLPWDAAILQDEAEGVTLRVRVRAQKTPFLLEKTLHLDRRTPRLAIAESLVNECPMAVPAMWGQHLAFGAPFLEPGSQIRLPDDGVTILPHDVALNAAGRRVANTPGMRWPLVTDAGGDPIDLRILPPAGTPSELLYLTGFPTGWYEVTTPRHQLTLRVMWDAAVLPYLWFWQEFGADQSYPWYGRLYTQGLEPFSSYPTYGLPQAVANGSALWLAPGETKQLAWSVAFAPQV